MAEAACYLVAGWLLFEAALKGLSYFGVSATYENAKSFYVAVGMFTAMPLWLNAIYVAFCTFSETEYLQEIEDSQPSRIEPLLTQQVDDSVPTLTRDSSSRLIQDI